MPKPTALFALTPNACEKIYGPEERAAIAGMFAVAGTPRTAAELAADPSLLADIDVLFSGWGGPKLDAAMLAAAPRLKAVFYGAGSVKGIVTEAFWRRDIVLTSSWGANAVPVAEMAEAQIILGLKRVWPMVFDGRSRKAWPKVVPVPGAYGSTVGLVSLGMIGRLVAQRLKTHDVSVLAYDPYVTQQQADAAGLGVRLVPLDVLFRESDVISLHAPNLPATRHMINAGLLAQMKPVATLINTARGAIVDEDALVDTLQRRPEFYAILDVTFPEPPPAGSPLYELPNVVLTPHVAGSLDKECRRMGQYALAEARRWLAGEPLRWRVTAAMADLLA